MHEPLRIYVRTSRVRVTIKSINLLVLVEVSVIECLYIGLVEDISGFREVYV